MSLRARASCSLPVHLKIDTGMHRLGVPADAAAEAMRRLRASTRLRWQGLVSHLADAEHRGSAQNAAQQRRFREVVALLTPEERERVDVHFANSAGALQRLPATRHDIVRPGLALFGEAPPQGGLELEPVLWRCARGCCRSRRSRPASGWVTAAAAWRRGRRGSAWSASATPTATPGERPARRWRWCEADAFRCVGAVSMDLLAVDLTDSGGGVGEEVTLIGRQGDDMVRVSELATWAGTIPYEILCHLRLRLPRIWVQSEAPSADSLPAGSATEARS